MISARLRLLLTFALLLEIGFLCLWKISDWNSRIPFFLTIYSFLFLAYACAVFFLIRRHFDSIPHVEYLVFATAVLFRLTLLFNEPTLSEDFYRYVWDGRVQNAGHGPYDYPPKAPELQGLRDASYERINHKDFRTPYAPTLEVLFRALTKITGNLTCFKLGILLFDFLLLEILRRLIRIEGAPPAMLLIYAWNPLPVVEFAGSGHADIVGICLLLATFLLVRKSRTAVGGLTFAAAALTKYLPVLALPWLARKAGWKFFLCAGLLGCVLILCYLTPDLRMFTGVSVFYTKWWFNDSLFSVFYKLMGGAEPARRFGFLFVCFSVVFCLVKKYDAYRSLFIVYGAVLLFSPVVHPWYLCWVLPFLVFYPRLPWLFLTGWIMLSYLIRYFYPDGVWPRILWLKLVIYIPFYAMLLWSLFVRKEESELW